MSRIIDEFYERFKAVSSPEEIENLVQRDFESIKALAAEIDDFRPPQQFKDEVIVDERVWGTSQGVAAICEKVGNKYKCIVGDRVFLFHPYGGFDVAIVDEIDENIPSGLITKEGDKITIRSPTTGFCKLEDVEYLGSTDINSAVYKARKVSCGR